MEQSRKLSKIEQGFIQMDRTGSPMFLQFLIVGNGECDRNQFENAVNEALKFTPWINVTKNGNTFTRRNDRVIVRVIDEFTVENDIDISTLFKDQLLEIVIIKRPKPVHLFRIFHPVTDAQGAWIFIRNVYRILRGVAPEKADSIINEKEFITPLPKSKGKMPMKFWHSVSKHYSKFNSPKPYFIRKKIAPVNFILPNLASALTDMLPGNDHLFLIPVDLRRHRPEIKSTNNLTLPVYFSTNKAMKKTGTLAAYMQLLKNRMEISAKNAVNAPAGYFPPFIMRAALRMMVRIQNRKKAFLVSGSLSHIGKFDLDEFSFGNFKAETIFSLPTQQPITPYFIHITEFRTHTELVFSSYEEYFSKAEAKQLLDDIAIKLKT